MGLKPISKNDASLDRVVVMRIKDERGKKYGALFVLEYAYSRPPGKTSRAHWLCQCACGKRLIVSGSHLRLRETTSCGCARVPHRISSERARYLAERSNNIQRRARDKQEA